MRRAIGVALQEAALDPLMTGRELIRLQATLHGLIGGEARAPRRRAARAGRARPRPPTAGSAPTRAACAGGSTSPRRSSTSRRCCSSTSRPPASTRSAARRSGRRSRRSTARARPSSSPPSTWRRPTSSPTGSGSSAGGKIVAEGTPASLKAEVGKPHLEIGLADGSAERAEEVCARLRHASLPEKDGQLLVELERGASDVAKVVRALDEAGILVESLELVEPTLDDVFVAKTGEHLEGADTAEPAEA